MTREEVEVDVDPKNLPTKSTRSTARWARGHGFMRRMASTCRGSPSRLPFCLEDGGSNQADSERQHVRFLLRERLIEANRLIRLINLLPLDQERREMLRRRVDGTVRELMRNRG
jgi:hypothetical protein